MEAVVLVVVLGALGLAVAAPLAALVALSRVSRLEKRLEDLERRLGTADSTRLAAERLAEPPAAARPRAAEAPPVEQPPVGQTPPAPEPPRAAPPPASAPVRRAKPPIAGSPPPPRRAPSADFATNLGPKILVGAGGLAVVVFLALFVRYAWENDWVGPAGRVLIGSVVSLALVAGGLRLIRGVYRPLGQGLAAAGFSGLYVSAYAAHGVYALVPRGLSAAVMIVVTVCAVAVADRLGARLLAALAWTGGYLTPVLVSTGEDRAVSLFAYLLLLGAGAIWLDRRKPWLETLPLAFTGTALLYGGWYAAHFRPERFAVAAAGLVLLTGLFALGSARKERSAGFAAALAAAAVGLALLAADAGRPEVLLPLSLVLAGVGLRAAGPLGTGVALAAGLVAGLPFLAWTAEHYGPESFGLAAAWVVGAAALFLLGAPTKVRAPVFPVAALVGGGAVSVELASRTDRPAALLVLLTAQAGLALLARRRWKWAETAGLGLASAAVLAWYERFFDVSRAADLLILGLVLAGVYATVLAVRGLAFRIPLRRADGMTQVLAAGLAWLVLDHVLGLTQPRLLGPAAAGLAALHLALGLAARRQPDQGPWTRVTLALAALFLTLAVPVQLGLFGITLAWAGEALVLLWLGVRHGSLLARCGGYGVLLLAVGRLLVRHLPLHDGPFMPVLNPVFGTWLLVIVAVALARRIAAGENGSALDRVAGTLLGPLGLALLFGLCTAETQAVFGERARAARAAGDPDSALLARRQAGLALSVLWTVFATGLLASGLAVRSRALFYTAYALFGVTALKVVMVDLATMPTLYRMLSFLALGVLLLAGAWLNLRFRERLVVSETRE